MEHYYGKPTPKKEAGFLPVADEYRVLAVHSAAKMAAEAADRIPPMGRMPLPPGRPARILLAIPGLPFPGRMPTALRAATLGTCAELTGTKARRPGA